MAIGRTPRNKKKAEEEGATLIYLDETSFQMMPTRRRTLAPKGETPTLSAWDKRGKISTIGAITISPKTKKEGFLFHMLPTDMNFNGDLVVDFLGKIGRKIPGPIKLVWDGAPIHRAKVVQCYLSKHPRFQVFRFPGYAPDLNPVEGCWGHTKYHQLPNLCVMDSLELREQACSSLNFIKSDRSLLKAFIQHAHSPENKARRFSKCSTQ